MAAVVSATEAHPNYAVMLSSHGAGDDEGKRPVARDHGAPDEFAGLGGESWEVQDFDEDVARLLLVIYSRTAGRCAYL